MHHMNIKMIIFTFFFVACCIQNISLLSIGNNIVLKPFHLLSICFLPFLPKNIKLPNIYIVLFYVLIITSSLVNVGTFGINGLLVKYIFDFYLLIIVLNFGRSITKEQWLAIFQNTAGIMMTLVCIKNYIQRDIIADFISTPSSHPLVNTIFGGGVNLEATWLGLFLFAFRKNRKSWIYLALCLFTSAVYASRVGFIVILLYLCWMFSETIIKKSTIESMAVLFFSISLLLGVYMSEKTSYVFDRMLSIGMDSGSIGRLTMWKYVPEAVLSNPLGVGIGNALDCIRNISGLNLTEDNLHNLFMQMFVELGWIGGLLYILIIVCFVYKNRNKVLKDNIIAMLFAYIVISLLQFKGGEPIIFFVLGTYLCNKSQEQHVALHRCE